MAMRLGLRAQVLVCLTLCACSTPPPRPHDAPEPEYTATLPGPAPYQFDCDAPEGVHKTIHVGLHHDQVLVTGTLTLLDPRIAHGRPAIAQVRLAAPAGANTRAAGFMAGIQMNSPHTILFYTADGDYDERFAALSATTLPIPFQMKLTENELIVTAAGVSKSIAVAHVKRSHLTLECSSAHVVFADVLPSVSH
jgi:hypothetical protein